MDQQQQQQLLLQQQQQQQQQQQFLLLQQLQKQAQHQHQQQQQQHQHQHQQQQQQASAISRFPSNIDVHLRPSGLHRQLNLQHPNPNPNPNANSNLQQQQLQQGQGSNLGQNVQHSSHQQQHTPGQQQQQQQLQQKAIRPPVNQVELQMAYQDAWRVCHPDFKRPFTSLEDACERLLPYHVVADYEAEEDDRILDSDSTGTMPSRSQQWDYNIAAKVAEFTGTFEKQALAFNIITRKRAMGEFRSEERLMIEQALLQEEKRMLLETKAEMEAREKAHREAQLRMAAAMAQAEQARAESHAHAEMMARGPIRANALAGSQGSIGPDMGEQEHNVNPDEMMNGWGNNMQRDDKEPSEDFLNDDEENDNGDTAAQGGEWREVGEFDLNSR